MKWLVLLMEILDSAIWLYGKFRTASFDASLQKSHLMHWIQSRIATVPKTWVRILHWVEIWRYPRSLQEGVMLSVKDWKPPFVQFSSV